MDESHGRQQRSTLERLQESVLRLDLVPEIGKLRQEVPYREFGRDAKTLVKYAGFRMVLTVLRGGTVIKEHKAAGPIAIQALDGTMRIRLTDRVVDLHSGQVMVLERGIPHDVEAERDSAFLITLAG